jgi:surface protein
MWVNSKDNSNDRIKELFNHLKKNNLIIKSFNMFDNHFLNIAVEDWINRNDQAKEFYENISDWDTSYVTDMSYLFLGKIDFNDDISKWDVSNVKDMNSMFEGATSFNQNIGSWNVSNVTDMSSMFRNAKSFDGDISTWNTSNVRFMEMMFEGAESFNQNINTKPIRNNNGEILYTAWDVSNVAYLYNMFKGATSFNGFVSDWTLDPNKLLISGLNITLYLKNLAGNIETIKINPFYTVARLKEKLYELLINKYGDLGNYRFLNILIDIPSEERRKLTNEEFLQRARLQDQSELRSYGIKNNDILIYIKTREEN